MKKTFLVLIIFASIFFALGSCNDAIFYKVYEETKQNDPLIDGSPTKFAVAGGYLWVASGHTLWRYRNNDSGSGWERFRQDSMIRDIAAFGNYVYLCMSDGSKGSVRRFNIASEEYSDIDNSNIIDAQTLYAANNKNVLFICSRGSSPSRFIYYYLNENSITPVRITSDADEFDSILNGAAHDGSRYYLSNKGGIFTIADSSLSSAALIAGSDLSGREGFTGIINLSADVIAAISRVGKLYKVTSTSVSEIAKFSNDDHSSTGALTLWQMDKDSPFPELLLAGRQGKLNYSTTTSYSHGYVEVNLTNGNVAGNLFSNPGELSPSSVASFDRFASSLGTNPVNSIIQTPYAVDKNMTLFASTQTKGVWSYRPNKDGEWYWNAEE